MNLNIKRSIPMAKKASKVKVKRQEASKSPKKLIRRNESAIDRRIPNVRAETRNVDRNPAETVTRIGAVIVDAEAVTMNLIVVETENETDEMVVQAILMTSDKVISMCTV